MTNAIHLEHALEAQQWEQGLVILGGRDPGKDKEKRSRTSTHKVRTGCITCKKRRVKCDEGKPSCRNCTRSHRQCGGYTAQQPKGPALVCWNSNSKTKPTRASPSSPAALQVRLDPDTLGIQDDQGVRYFREFITLAQGSWTNSAFNNELWEVTLPQLAHHSAPLRHAAMAIGALSFWHREAAHESLRAAKRRPDLLSVDRDSHYFHALSHYGKSLRVQREQPSVQDALFLSLLLIFFETLQDNRKTALSHLNHGSCLLLNWISGKDGHQFLNMLGPNPKSVLGSIADIFRRLALQAYSILFSRISDGPSLPNLVTGLKTLESNVETFMLRLGLLTHPSLSLDNIPEVFHTLDEFEEYISALWVTHTNLGQIMKDAMKGQDFLNTPVEGIITDIIDKILRNNQIQEFSNNTSQNMDKIDRASRPLFDRLVMSDKQSPSYIRAIHLRLQLLSFSVQFVNDPAIYLDVDSLATKQTPIYREYLSLCNIAVRAFTEQSKTPAQQLSLQCDMAWHLLVISFFCRDPLTRDEAVWMLRDYPGQDGLWNTRALYHLAERNRTMELRNASEGSFEEQWKRLWRREFLFEDGGDRIVFRFMDKDDTTGEWSKVEEVAEVGYGFLEVKWKRQPITGSGGFLAGELYATSYMAEY